MFSHFQLCIIVSKHPIWLGWLRDLAYLLARLQLTWGYWLLCQLFNECILAIWIFLSTYAIKHYNFIGDYNTVKSKKFTKTKQRDSYHFSWKHENFTVPAPFVCSFWLIMQDILLLFTFYFNTLWHSITFNIVNGSKRKTR